MTLQNNKNTVPWREASQIPFDLGFRSAMGRVDFLIGKSNQSAVGWIDKWPDWPAPMLILHGPAASGKSHLASVWHKKTGAIFVKPEMLTKQSAQDLFDLGKPIILDGLDLWLGERSAETTLFHLYNMLKEEGRTMLVTLRMSPSEVDFAIADLASRFRAAPVVTIQSPDDVLLGSVLIKLFRDRQLTVSNDVIAYLLPRMERSFAAAREIVETADCIALSEKRPISVALVRQVLNMNTE